MRTIALFLVLALAFGCGDNPDFSNQNQPGTENAGENAAQTTTEPETPETQMASPEATELTNAYYLAKNAKDPKKVALQQLQSWEGKTVPADALYFLGLLHQYAEQWDKAANAFSEFVEKAPGDKNEKWGLYSLVDCLIKAGRESDAGKYLTRFGEKYPEEVKYWRSMESTLATTLAEKGKLEESAPHWAKAFELGDYYSGEEWVMVLTGLGKYDEARAAAKKLSTIANGEKEQARAKHWVERTEKMGKPAPDLNVVAWANPEGFSSGSLSGKVLVVYFWTTGSQSAGIKNDKEMKQVWDAHAGDDFMIVGLSKHDKYDFVESKKKEGWTTDDELENLRQWVYNAGQRWLSPTPTPWALGLTEGTGTEDAFGYGGINPTFVVIDKKGNWRYYRQGHDPKGYVQLGYVVDRLLKE